MKKHLAWPGEKCKQEYEGCPILKLMTGAAVAAIKGDSITGPYLPLFPRPLFRYSLPGQA